VRIKNIAIIKGKQAKIQGGVFFVEIQTMMVYNWKLSGRNTQGM